jgi:NADH dehydrogenase/NADH:ubiquinone oxidoreductase subunit G
MKNFITLTIDGQEVTVHSGTTLLKAAQELGIEIPTICYHEACTSNGLCRLCVVEVETVRTLQPACTAMAVDGMVVHTKNPRVERSRRTILEMLNSTVDLSEAPEIQDYMQAYAADPGRFPEAERREPPVLDDNPMYVRDYAKCVLCWRCVQVCAEDAQYTFALNFSGRAGFRWDLFDKHARTTCVFCGQCVGVCPTGAPKREWLLRQAGPGEIIDRRARGRERREVF